MGSRANGELIMMDDAMLICEQVTGSTDILCLTYIYNRREGGDLSL